MHTVQSQYEQAARKIFSRFGLDFTSAAPAEAWTNAVWLTENAAVRVATEKGTERIRREAELARFLPGEVNYPKLIGVGVEYGHEWSVAERIKAAPLRESTGGLDEAAKIAVIEETLAMMKAVHEKVSLSEAAGFSQTYSWFSSFEKSDSMKSLEKYARENIFNENERETLRLILERFFAAREKENPVLCHGDITEDNLLYDNRMVSLIDFENSVIAPAMLDIHAVYNLAFPNPDAPGSPSYVTAVKKLLSPWLEKEGAQDLLRGYAVMFQQRILECWLKHPAHRLEDSKAYQKLRRLLSCSHTI